MRGPPDPDFVHDEPQTARALRRMLLAILVFGIVGITVELLLLGHSEERMQLVPLVMLALALLTVAAWVLGGRRWGVQAVRAVMALFVPTGLLGLYNHYHGNVEFELEMYPSMRGSELISKTMTGATPVLAPGTMAMLGLVGLALVYRHPAIDERHL